MADSAARDTGSTADRDIVTLQTFDAPRERVFAAWTDPAQVARWWGPVGFRNTFETFEPRPGGQWRFIMHGPDGTDFRNQSVFVEVQAPERIVFDHLSGPHFRVLVTFEAEGPKTRLSFTMRFDSAEECEAVKRFALEGNEQTFSRLAALLAEG